MRMIFHGGRFGVRTARLGSACCDFVRGDVHRPLRLRRLPLETSKPYAHGSQGMILLRIISLAVLFLIQAAQAGPPVLKAKTEEPALQETMGGCSLKCAFKWGAEMQPVAGKARTIRMLNDEDAETAWVADPGTSGVGVKFRFIFPKKLIAELEGTPFYGLDLINGVWRTEQEWKAHGRVKRVRLHYNAKPLCDVAFADNRRWQRLSFPDILMHSGDSMTMEILEIYPGENGAGAAITELVLQGAH